MYIEGAVSTDRVHARCAAAARGTHGALECERSVGAERATCGAEPATATLRACVFGTSNACRVRSLLGLLLLQACPRDRWPCWDPTWKHLAAGYASCRGALQTLRPAGGRQWHRRVDCNGGGASKTIRRRRWRGIACAGAHLGATSGGGGARVVRGDPPSASRSTWRRVTATPGSCSGAPGAIASREPATRQTPHAPCEPGGGAAAP